MNSWVANISDARDRAAMNTDAMSSDAMNIESAATRTVIHRHLQTFLAGQGAAAIVADYHDDADFYTEDRIYRGPAQIADFFTGFLGALPAEAIENFALTSEQVHGTVGLITWQVAGQIPLGADTFLVRDGKIVSQTFVMIGGAGS